MNEVQEKYADRIAKLLAKAESTNSQAEADAFFAKAQALMTEHSITSAMIADKNGAAADSLTDGEMYFTGIYMKVTMKFAFIVADYNNVKCVYRETTVDDKKAIKVSMFGFKTDVIAVELLVNSLQMQSAQAMQRWARDSYTMKDATPMEKFKEKREFILGFQSTIMTRLREAREVGRRAAAEAANARGDNDGATSVALVIQSKDKLVAEGFHKKYPRLSKGRSGVSSRGSAAAQGAGRAAGAHATLSSGKSVGGTRGSLNR